MTHLTFFLNAGLHVYIEYVMAKNAYKLFREMTGIYYDMYIYIYIYIYI